MIYAGAPSGAPAFGVELNMKWCVSYKCNTDILKEANEIRFSSFNEIFPLRDKEEYKSKRLILEILQFEKLTLNGQPMTYDMLGSLLKDMDNLFLDFYLFDDLISFDNETQYEYRERFMFHYPVDTYALLNILLDHHVSDITLNEPLIFDIQNVEHFIHYNNPTVCIRMRPYIGRAAWMLDTEDMCHFWVLPQHIYLYENYVNVIDILANSVMREETLFKIYRSGTYQLDMAVLIDHFDVQPTVKGAWIDDALAMRRLNCKQICQSTKPKRCHVCQLSTQLLAQMPRAAYMREHNTQSQS